MLLHYSSIVDVNVCIQVIFLILMMIIYIYVDDRDKLMLQKQIYVMLCHIICCADIILHDM